MDKIFRLTKETKFFDGDENFVQRKILFDENFVRHCFVRQVRRFRVNGKIGIQKGPPEAFNKISCS